ncbi:MAG: zinc ribbon domain-containing protein [Spirochaetes bacterium]|nr:zinc ribbon domain-containing protein [Spirochaetota bacterium]
MPTYDYECTKCGHAFHLFQSIHSKPQTPCPKCKSVSQRLIGTGGGIIFKGSGFYVNDYKKSSGSAGSSQSTSESKTESKTESNSTEKKSENKSNTKKDIK